MENKKYEPGLFGGEPEIPKTSENKKPKTIKDFSDRELTDLKRITDRKRQTGEPLKPREEAYLDAMTAFMANTIGRQEKK